MNWSSEHRESERLAAAAHETLQHGDAKRAQGLFAEAAMAEIRALDYIGSDKPRTLGITTVSAVSLLYKAGIFDAAEELAHKAAANHAMPPFALAELRSLLQTIWYEQAQTESGISLLPRQVVVSIKGGEIIAGGAPLDIILGKVKIIQTLFYRTAEFLKSMPLRKGGRPSREIRERCKLWLLQTVPGSYQFIVALQKPLREISDDLEPEALTDTFLSIVAAAGEAPEEKLRMVVPKDDYRKDFLKLTHDLADGDKVFDRMEIRGSGDYKSIILSDNSRKLISDRLNNFELTGVGQELIPQIQTTEMLPPTNQDQAGEEETTLRGVLRAVDLDKGLLEVWVNRDRKQVTGIGEVVADLVGSMLNHEVSVRVRRGELDVLTFIDIQRDGVRR
jgi:hypothetical protein